MNSKEYISSGIIESYVLGLATEAERAEFESYCKLYPEIEEARNQFELQLQQKLLNDAISPPQDLKAKIQKQIAESNVPAETDDIQKKITPVRRISFWKVAAAACFILLTGIAIWTLSVNNKYKDLKEANAQLKNDLNIARQEDPFKALQPIVQRPSIKWSALLEKNNSSHCMGHIYWDSLSKDTYMLIGNMPQTPSDKQYQLWALIDNQPIDLGVFDIKKEGLLVKMKNVQNAEAFAITLEPRGGSVSPTMEAMYAVGKL
jgi:anti-sigma-K factor RskA